MKFYLLLFLLILGRSFTFAQVETLTAEERAYLFHIVKKSPILDLNIGRYFEYTGEPIFLKGDELNYDSLEINIINQPDLLKIHTSEIRKSPIGILAEAANKTAIWEVNKMLLAFRTDDKKSLEIFQSRFTNFLDSLLTHLPTDALKTDRNDEVFIHNKVKNLLNPSLNLNDKIKMIETFRFIDKDQKMATIEAIQKTIVDYVQNRSYQIFTYLGGATEQYHNVLVAAGDGSSTAGLLEEREKDERGKWNKGLPKAIGLFPYQLYKTEEKREATNSLIAPRNVTTNTFKTFGSQLITNIHLDVWGYNSKKQTTIIIEKNGKSYPLFGSGENRFLSPDSAFAEGITYQYIIDNYRQKIAQIEEKINGKKGFDYWIKFYENRRDKLQSEVVDLEQQIAHISGFKIHTKGRDKKAVAGELDNTSSNKKKRKDKQALYIDRNGQLAATKNKIKELEKEKAEAIEKQNELNRKLAFSLDAFGRNWVPFTEKEGIYTFQDSTQFDILTQEFIFPPKDSSEFFEVRLIAIPNAIDSPLSDEVMLHINVTSTVPEYNNRVQLAFNDIFDSNQWSLKKSVLQQEDSLSIKLFLEQLLDKEKNFDVILRGNGVGVWNGNRTVYKYPQEESSSYPSEEAKNKSEFKRLRTSYVDVNINRDIRLEINSFTDNIRTSFDIPNKTILKLIEKKQATYNQVLSGYRTASILFKLQEELNLFAGSAFEREEAKIIIDRLNTTINKAKILVNQTSLKAILFK